MDAQLRELLTNYGEIGGIWFDGWWDRPDANWRLDRDLLADPPAAAGGAGRRESSPAADSRAKTSRCSRRTCPAAARPASTRTRRSATLPLETCETMNGAWGFNITDRRYKSHERAGSLSRARRRRRTPTSSSTSVRCRTARIQPEFVTRLQEVGAWMAKNGESIYGTRGGPIAPRPWGVTTRKGTAFTCTCFDSPDPSLLLPPLPSARALGEAAQRRPRRRVQDRRRRRRDPVAAAQTRDPIDTIVVLELEPGRK